MPGYGIATFYFSNLASGSNSCGVDAPLVLAAKCSITPGIQAYAKYSIGVKGPPPASPQLVPMSPTNPVRICFIPCSMY